MTVKVLESLRVAKIGFAIAECEDRYNFDLDHGVFAVADGASSSAFPGRWALCLIDHFLARPTVNISDEWLTPARKSFIEGLDLKQLPWHALEKLQSGAYSTLLGLMLHEEKGSFSAVAAGDSVLVWRTDDGPCRTLPSNPVLTNFPHLVSNLSEQNAQLEDKLERLSDEPIGGKTRFYLMTDALAGWFVNQQDLGRRPDLVLDRLLERKLLDRWVDLKRQRRQMVNDDVTLVVLEAVRTQ
ncbi:hypothetical protein DYH09_21760 [bacterium CPR1]|nr:hypothetical protein [bacterium CPR1]